MERRKFTREFKLEAVRLIKQRRTRRRETHRKAALGSAWFGRVARGHLDYVCSWLAVGCKTAKAIGVDVPPMLLRWGLVPSWWSKPLKELRLATFNARAETVAGKPMFRDAFKRTRCLIPASGYYEWHDTPDGKQPYYFTRRDGQLITIAGLWDEWRDKQVGETVKSCAMVITDANEFVGEIHDRMPAMLESDQFEPWLACRAGVEVLKPAANDVLQRWPVSKRVNSSRAHRASWSGEMPRRFRGAMTRIEGFWIYWGSEHYVWAEREAAPKHKYRFAVSADWRQIGKLWISRVDVADKDPVKDAERFAKQAKEAVEEFLREELGQ